MRESEQSKQEQQSLRNLLMLKGIHRGLVSAYPEIRALDKYSGFKEYRLSSFRTQMSELDLNLFERYCKDRTRNVSRNRPMCASYVAIAQKEKYRKNVSTQLVQSGVLDSSDIIYQWRTPASVAANGVARETILLGLEDDSLLVDLSVFSPKLKSLESI